MPPSTLLKFPTSSPSDTTPLLTLSTLHSHNLSQSPILAILGKTEGNGCVNDFSRTLSTHIWSELDLIPSTALKIFSGGTEGVLSPHLNFILSSPSPTGLVVSVSRTWKLQPWQLGTLEHVACVAAAVRKMCELEGLKPHDVQMVLVKCPLLTSERVQAALEKGYSCVTRDSYESMARSRYASAVGVGVGLGEVGMDEVEGVLKSGEFFSAKASCSAGAEVEDCHVLVLGNDSRFPPLQGQVPPGTENEIEAEVEVEVEAPPTTLIRAFSGIMASAIDFAGLQAVLTAALTPNPPYRKAELLQVFAKAEADPTGLVAGRFRHTMLTDSDLHSTRHARAAVGGLIAGVTGDCCVYVSGGAEGQGPKGGGGICVVARWEV